MEGTSDSGVRPPRVALVLLGGGARAAYQVGFLRCLARRMPDVHFEILVGVSSGAINVAHLASRTCPFPEAVTELGELWAGLTPESVMEVDSLSLLKNVFLWSVRLISGGRTIFPPARGLVDCRPLEALLKRNLGDSGGTIRGIDRNIRSGHLEAVALSATRYTTGESVTFVQGCGLPEEWSRPRRIAIRQPLTVDHVMASAALPLILPAVEIDGAWYGDGAVRQATPLAPAIGLGARRIVAVSTHCRGAGRPPSRPVVEGYPPPAQVAGTLLNSVFLDRLHDDVRRLERANCLLESAPDHEGCGLRRVEAFVLRPSVDLGELSRRYENRLPRAFRFMTRGLGTRETSSPDLLSMILFEPAYIRHLMEVGERDAQERSDELRRFLQGGKSGKRVS
ncbi:MAG: patatin [Gemmatimonadetes bacterium]|nr:patatin [Gemmatimonadota bacterium]NIR80317.1 patatin [Gemmatimonadota bacterium]NIT89080.1 patatin [Gemmatimonadota bacterium]NIU32877.1 patatin [Gemmatimonadota bacterium]NIU37283.1 patatin [Gemmatimonadota bacterium]